MEVERMRDGVDDEGVFLGWRVKLIYNTLETAHTSHCLYWRGRRLSQVGWMVVQEILKTGSSRVERKESNPRKTSKQDYTTKFPLYSTDITE